MRYWKYIYNKSGNYDYLIGKSSNYLGRKGDKIVEDIINEVKYQLRVYNIYIKPNKEINSYNIEDEIRDELRSKVFSIKKLQEILDSLKGKSEANGRTKIIAPLDSFLTKKRNLVSYKKKKTKEIKKVHEKEEEAEKIEVYKIPKEEAEKIPEANIIHENENKEEEKKIEPNAEENKDSEKSKFKLFGNNKKECKNKEVENENTKTLNLSN